MISQGAVAIAFNIGALIGVIVGIYVVTYGPQKTIEKLKKFFL